MTKTYNFKKEKLEELQQYTSSIKTYPRLIKRINRLNTDYYTLTIDGNESDINGFIEELKLKGIYV